MPLIDKILKHKSLSIVGMYKNTGKTETLNYVLSALPTHTRAAVTSIGIDGERVDAVSGSSKPEVTLRSGTVYATSEALYSKHTGTCEVLTISTESTSLGRVVTARVIYDSKVLISGASSTLLLSGWVDMVQSNYQIDIVIVDGALSRLSSASPVVSEAMVLATGAALSSNIETLVAKTAYTVELIRLPKVSASLYSNLSAIESGIWGVTLSGKITQMPFSSTFSAHSISQSDLQDIEYLYISGALTDRLIETLRRQKLTDIVVVVQDFTRIFISEMEYRAFRRSGGSIRVLRSSELLAITINPTSPSGYQLDSNTLRERLAQRVELPVYDLLN